MHRFTEDNPLVYTVKGLCRVCYTCVRECPAKAIKIINGQAEVINARCIACGNCVIVCSQGAKSYHSSLPAVEHIIQSTNKSMLCIAPSFAAEFTEIEDYRILVGMIKAIGFDYVTEVSFGADLVALSYKELFDSEKTHSLITSDCPAIVNYISQYHPALLELLAQIDSPAMAMAKVVKKKYGEDLKLVFAGPCIAKKAESYFYDANITFQELRNLFEEKNISSSNVKKSDFDPPHSSKGAFFPVNHGLLKSIDKAEGLGEGEVITAEGKAKFKEAIEELENGLLKNQHLELLCCDGCIEGPGMTQRNVKLVKRLKISNYVKEKLKNLDIKSWEEDIAEFSTIDLSRRFTPRDCRIPLPEEEEISKVLQSMGKTEGKDLLNCGACGYPTCRELAIAVCEELAEPEMCLPYTIEKLSDTQEALIQSEKLASMGQVSAGIAHELNNPLGIITLYSSILQDELNPKSEFYEDIQIINEQAERCKTIVGGLLNFARKNRINLKETNLAEFIKRSFNSLIKPDIIEIKLIDELKNPVVKIDREQMMQVMTNLEKNAMDAMPEGGELSIYLKENEENFIIEVSDTGTGIPEENFEKIFTPFFTTKGAAKGTGLGLPLVYGIVKMHRGKISVKSNTNPDKGATGTTFKITIPKNLDAVH
ncbi:MAG: ATP-binding protein [Bacteroidales bacterium]|nr:ATP-binding protein [Bacteroidales bacterium]